MKRRSAIKNIGIGMGASVSMGTFISMIASCKSESLIDNASSFFTDTTHLTFVENIADIIFPKTDTPGAKEVGVINYIDMAVSKLYDSKEQERFKKGLKACIEAVGDGDLGEFIQSKIGDNADKTTFEAMSKLIEKEDAPEDASKQNDYYLYSFLNAVKSLTIGGYFSNEIIATKHMVYEPVPGPYVGCIDWEGGNNYYQ